jgi:DHA2 family methylenomycin A resistance protein-like MFS transporter
MAHQHDDARRLTLPRAVDTPLTRTGAPQRRGLVLAAASLGFGVVQLDVSIVNVAVKAIGTSLGGGVSGLQWVVDAYTVGLAALILTAGSVGDRLGGKRVFIAGFCLFTLASAACGLAPTMAVLIASRAVQGVGAAILGACSLILLNHAFPGPRERARAVGLWAAGASSALAGGPLVGGVLIATLGWRSIFFINAPAGLAGIWLTARYAAQTPRTAGGGVDWWGQLSAIVALASFAGATIEGGQRGFTSPAVLAGFVVAVAAGAVFVMVEARREFPMLPLGLFRSRTFSAATATGFAVNIAFYGLIFVFSLFFQRLQGRSPLATGAAFAPVMVAIMASNILVGRVIDAFGVRRVAVTGALAMSAGCLPMLGATAATPTAALVAPLAVIGFGLGLLVPAITSALLGSVDRARSGVTSGTLNALRQTGSVLGVALFGSMVASSHLVGGLHLSLAVSAALTLVAAALAALIPGTLIPGTLTSGRDRPAPPGR